MALIGHETVPTQNATVEGWLDGFILSKALSKSLTVLTPPHP